MVYWYFSNPKNNKMKIQGKYNEAIIYSDEIDNAALTQIYSMLNNPSFSNSKIRIMPDVHFGKGSVVGFTMQLNEFVSPNVVGVDIGCGVDAYKIGSVKVDLKRFDEFINLSIPSGRKTNEVRLENYYNLSKELEDLILKVSGKQYDRILKSIGTLGGGNHFIELNIDSNDNIWLLIHTGSRYLGVAVYGYHIKQAKKYIMKKYNGAGAFHGNEYLPVKGEGEEYIADMKITQQYAFINREVIARNIIDNFFKVKFKNVECIKSTHNYIDFDDRIVRKGAISAHKDELLVIPLNMRDGVLFCKGKGNNNWNFSAPHGAGRILSRREAKDCITMNEFKNLMEGIYSSSIKKSTLDESPMAYKPKELIMSSISETVEIIDIAKPIYNFKSGN